MVFSKKEQAELIVILLVLLLGVTNVTNKFKMKLLNVNKKVVGVESKKELLKEVADLYAIMQSKKKNFALKGDLRSLIYSSAKACKINIQAIVPKKQSEYLGLSIQPMNIEIRGGFSGLLCFLSKLEDSENGFIVVEDFNILRQKKLGNTLIYYATVNIKTFKANEKK